MSNISVNTITDASGGSTASINGLTPQASNMQPHNLIINGAMTVAQRGTSTSSITGGDTYPTVDRFMLRVSSAGTWTHSQSTDAPSGFSSSLKMDCTTADASLAADDNVRIQYRFEGQDLQQLEFGTSDAKSFTISFWAKATKTGTNIIEMYQDDGNDHISKTYTINLSNTWEYKTLTFSGNTLASIANDNTRGLILQFWIAAGSNFQSGTLATAWAGYVQGNEAVGQVNHADNTSNTFYITGVQLEAGSTASSFAHENYSDTLQKCQRYYYDSRNGYGNTLAGNTHFQAYSTTGGVGSFIYKQTMRAAPAIYIFATSNDAAGTVRKTSNGAIISGASTTNIGINSFSFLNCSGLISGDPYDLTFKADAEL